MDDNSKVSVVLPTYNGAKYIRQSIDSCLNQTYKNIELIIVDDGSTDKTNEIITSYKDKRIKYIKHEINKGLPIALNSGFKIATGNYFTWTSDDNYYKNDAIEKMILFLNENNYSFVYCDFYIIKDNDSSPPRIRKPPDKIAFEKGNYLGACFLYSRIVSEVIGNYDPDTKLAEDYDYWIRISKKFPMGHINEPLYYYRVRKNSLYFSKYYEVKIVDFLVRLKNDILNIDQITNLYINLMAQKNVRFLKKSLLKKINIKIYKILIRIFQFKKIYNILKLYKMGEINFGQAKDQLINKINIPILYKF